ncbi:MAG: DUF6057 family protein [Phycisphaerae bacterium]|nr:DUF6057 family protein [Phycisphaerae bacterium]
MRDEGKKVRTNEGEPVGCAVHTNHMLASWWCAQHTLRPTFLPSYLLTFLLCFVYLWLVVEPDLIYYCFGTILPDAPPFATGWAFLRDSLGTPGGPVAYAAGFLSQGYYYAWLGAALITLAGLGLSELCRRHLVTAGLVRASVLATFPAIMLFLVYSHYKHPLTVCLAVSLGLALSLAFERLPMRQPLVRVAVCCLVATAGFWLGGAGTLLVFAMMAAVHGILVRRDWTTVALALPASAAIVWAFAQYVFLIPARQAFVILTPFVATQGADIAPFLKVLTSLLYAFAPLAVLLVLLGKRLLSGRGRAPSVPPKKIKGKEKYAAAQPLPRPDSRASRPRIAGWKPATHRSWAVFARLALSAVPVVLMALGLYFGGDELRKPYVLSNYYSRQKQWDKVLELAGGLPKGKNNVYVNHDITRALYHTGRLPYDMFRYPQDPQALLLTHEKRESDLTEWKLSDIFLELGHVNMAQKLASELLTTKDHFGVALEELGWISIIKGYPSTARVYLTALKRDLLYRERAESLLRGLDSGFTPAQAAYIGRIRSYLRDEMAPVTGTEPVDQTLAALLKHNPHNKMAFEYLMACYLLTGRVDKIVENMERLPGLGYQTIPTLYEEAILIYYGSRQQAVDPAKFNISQETLHRYETFAQIRGTAGPQNSQAVLTRLIRDFGTSYFFYYVFGQVGLM